MLCATECLSHTNVYLIHGSLCRQKKTRHPSEDVPMPISKTSLLCAIAIKRGKPPPSPPPCLLKCRVRERPVKADPWNARQCKRKELLLSGNDIFPKSMLCLFPREGLDAQKLSGRSMLGRYTLISVAASFRGCRKEQMAVQCKVKAAGANVTRRYSFRAQAAASLANSFACPLSQKVGNKCLRTVSSQSSSEAYRRRRRGHAP